MNRKLTDRAATGAFTVVAMLIVIILSSLISYILYRGFSHMSWDFLTSAPSAARAGGGIGPPLFNSFYMLILTMLFTVPLGLGGGIYMAQYAKRGRFTNFIRTCIEVLASLPSIVVGLFGLLVFVQLTGWSYSILGGALALTIFNLPVMVRVVEDALRSVPQAQTDASLALGVTKWDTIRTVLLPAAFPGILTGVILSSGRVFGEAAALLFTSGVTTPRLDWLNLNPFSESSPLNIFRPAETLSVHIWKINTQGLVPDVKEIADGAALVLIVAVLLFNVLARLLGAFVHRKMTASK
ncbi:phosphate ABC transporter permease PstA [Shouchella lonarensis]|uniref:Phosphate transport system permease protein PstA n=1 Tax=Shouchella lonarensis TaxID=1464122 RepID=A0A1G6JYH5_9BACI|nr:phosphate ABC transporter permease PstA [Shouchella lonarensis]SDC23849.1 phosphate ABC transporter membrane protein 2, PhoT family [Shouchella lonarensis]